MTITDGTPPRLSVERDNLFDPPRLLAALPPVSRVVFPSGADGWVVTGHAEARALFSEPRLSADRTRAHHLLRPGAGRQSGGPPPGMFVSMDPPEHTRYRRMLTAQFTLRRMRALEPRIEQIVADRLDVLAAAGAPADLVSTFALPVPSLTICELLGVDYADRDLFQHLSGAMQDSTLSPAQVQAAAQEYLEFMAALARAKRARPDERLISGLVTDTDLTEREIAGIGMLLLIAGHETTANMLSLGTFALLQNPGQLRLLRENPELLPGAVEELLRYLSIAAFIAGRVATDDFTIAGARIQAGDTVLLLLSASNRDPALTDRPDELDVTRGRTHHLAFGHGIHQCLGQQLARVELRIGFRRLFERFPTLRLAVGPQEVVLRTDMEIYGVHSLPVTW
ncbi:cytochrome P450 [Amycolatopsis saalfeldensis]|uniref:Cytochrome P450 n=1 Tax=Amycolatopsis saalfeldensis TaxID=394193 RepID=A0A1H8YPF2_9PSEU|nr:cytochrome P450 [Amycolatopsis saalfeldensis]SEP53912.1 Cytochrome P450 [Amycolatopsis saalfeldensis]